MEFSNKIYELLGRLSVQFGDLQFFSAHLFNSFSISRKSGFEILHKKSFKQLIEKIENYIPQLKLDKEDNLAMERLCIELHNVRERRNEIFHSVFVIHNESEKRIDLNSLYKRTEKQYVDINADTINEIITQIEDLSTQMIYATANIQKIITSA